MRAITNTLSQESESKLNTGLLAIIAWAVHGPPLVLCASGFSACTDSNLQFEVHSVAVSGGPWNTMVVVEWTDRAIPADGQKYKNSGVHIVRLRWGKVISIHAYLDTQVIQTTL